MIDEADLDDLARRYLELWREQVSAMASDPQTVETLSRAFAAFGQTGAPEGTDPANLFPWLSTLQNMTPPISPGTANARGATSEGVPDFDAAFRAFTGQAAGPAPRAETTAAQSDDGGQSLFELERRVAALEERLTELEPKPRKSRKKSARRPAKGKS